MDGLSRFSIIHSSSAFKNLRVQEVNQILVCFLKARSHMMIAPIVSLASVASKSLLVIVVIIREDKRDC